MGSGRIWVPKKSGFLWVLGDFGFPTTSLLMGSGSKSLVQVGFWYFFWGSGTKRVGVFPWVLGFRVPEAITNLDSKTGEILQ